MDVIRRQIYVQRPSSPSAVKKKKNTLAFPKFMTSSQSIVAPVMSRGLPIVQPTHALLYPSHP